MTLFQRFVRLATRASVAFPRLWPLFRPLVRRQFDELAPTWDGCRRTNSLEPLDAALDRLAEPPGRVLDVGTGTGIAARRLAERFPDAEVVGVDLAPGMVEEARRLLPEEVAARVRFVVADATTLPFGEAEFGLVTLLNMIPFPDELARVLEPGGTLAVVFSRGPETPIWAPPETLRARLAPAGFGDFEEVSAGSGTALLARRVSGVSDVDPDGT